MRKPVIVATAIVAAALAAGFAFAGVQTTQGQASTPERDATYRSCLQAADAKFDGLNLDLLVGDAADKVALRNRAMRAHCDAYRADLTTRWNGFADSCQDTAAYSGLEGKSLSVTSISKMRQICTAMTATKSAAK
ncbi:hypothetical protein [Aquidulcibacter sp.]|jgi:hypothetical protein|uniref:hypothetical protein n=1 Tax=Aquidulcibacter sp. TaxID=2052990 RepID=UPI0037BE3DBC